MDRYKIWFLKSQNNFFDKDFFPILVFAEYIKYTKKETNSTLPVYQLGITIFIHIHELIHLPSSLDKS